MSVVSESEKRGMSQREAFVYFNPAVERARSDILQQMKRVSGSVLLRKNANFLYFPNDVIVDSAFKLLPVFPKGLSDAST